MNIPSALNDLVVANLSPGATIAGSKVNISRRTLDFIIQWRGRPHALSITREQWDDQRLEIIELYIRLAVPYPEATRAGQRFWISYSNLVTVQGDLTTWPFLVQSDVDGSGSKVEVTITGTAHALLEKEAVRRRHDERAFRIAAAIWHLKTHFDIQGDLRQQISVTMDLSMMDALLSPIPATDQQVRQYTGVKMHQAYKGSDISSPLEFNWTDFDYLGIKEADFWQAIKLREGVDWSTRGHILVPTVSLIERLDKGEVLYSSTNRDIQPKQEVQKIKRDYGKWEIVKSLPEGGQAYTFLVRNSDGSDSNLYVLKRLKNPKRLGRFTREIETGLRLVHPNLIKIIDFDIEGSTPYLVSEYCEGGDLKRKGVGQGLGAIGGLRFLHPICLGVAHAHKNGVIHRDLNPKNIFLDPENRPVVGDFGICFLDEQGERLTLLGEAVGPRLYMAPELEDGRVNQVSPRSDVYSLGKLLYWLITGTEFAREKHRHSEFDLSKKLKDPRMEHVNRLLDKMVATDPSARLPSAVEVINEIEEAITMLEKGFNVVAHNVEQRCIYCGKGTYQSAANGSPETGYGQVERFGLTVRGRAGMRWKVFVCDNCGNMQFFRPDHAHNPRIWD